MAAWPATVVFRLAFFYWALLLCRSVRPPRQSLCATTPVVLCDYPLSLCATRYGVIHRGCQHVGVGLLTVLVGPVHHHHPARFGERLDVTHHGRAVHPGVLGDALIRRPRVARGVRSQSDRPRHRARGTGQVGVPHATHPRVRLHSSSPGLHSGHSHGGGSFGGLTLGIVQPIYFSFTSGGHNTSEVGWSLWVGAVGPGEAWRGASFRRGPGGRGLAGRNGLGLVRPDKSFWGGLARQGIGKSFWGVARRGGAARLVGSGEGTERQGESFWGGRAWRGEARAGEAWHVGMARRGSASRSGAAGRGPGAA